jgi:hypothetical protein
MVAGQAFEADGSRFVVDGTRLIFDTEVESDDFPDEIVDEDALRLRAVLSDSPDISELDLNSSGGSIPAGQELAWIVMDYGLDTLVVGECTSACVDVFLAGERRRMALGSKIGFHRGAWSPESVASFYEEARGDFGWDSPFDFGSWIYEDTQQEIFEYLTFMMDRGVAPAFAVMSMRAEADDMWYPNRLQLMACGVLREAVREEPGRASHGTLCGSRM